MFFFHTGSLPATHGSSLSTLTCGCGYPISLCALAYCVNNHVLGGRGAAGSCAIVQYICRFFEEHVDDSLADTSKLYEGCSIETMKF